MSTAYILCAAMFGQIASAEDVISQMQAQHEQIQTLEFVFHLEVTRGPGYDPDDVKKVVVTKTKGRLRFRAPHEVKLERLNESGDVLEARVISSDGAQMKGYSVLPETGSVDGFVDTATDGRFYLSSFTGIGWLFRHDRLNEFRRFLTYKDMTWQVSTVGDLLRLNWSGLGGLTWDIDPARGYWVVTGSNTVRDVFRKDVTEPVEIKPGTWIAKRAENEQTRSGKVFYKVNAAIDLDSVKVNQPLDPKAFEIVFPKGTRVDNLLTNTTEFVGGQNSRDRKSVEQLAALSNTTARLPSSKEELIPGTSALSVPEASLWNDGYLIGVVSSLLVILGGWLSWQRWWRS